MQVRTPSFLNAYIVATQSVAPNPLGVVRKDGHVWRILKFGIPWTEQPREAFKTRGEAGRRLVEMSLASAAGETS